MIQSSPRTSAQNPLVLSACAPMGSMGREVRPRDVIEKLSEAIDRGLSQEPDPELITQLQQIYLAVEGDLEDI
jgi:hypothetical protein